MKKFTTLLSAAILSASASTAFAADNSVTVVKFRADDCQTCSVMESNLATAMSIVNSAKVKEVTIDSTNSLKWEVSAHKAFDGNVVPQFNKWVGKTGFVAVVDTSTRRTIGCVTDSHDPYKIASFIKSTVGLPHDRNVANRSSDFKCPPAFDETLGK